MTYPEVLARAPSAPAVAPQALKARLLSKVRMVPVALAKKYQKVIFYPKANDFLKFVYGTMACMAPWH